MKRKKKNSTIRESELGVLKWFHDKWLNHETPEKVQFYLWLEADYMEHLKQYTSNRDTYFSSEQKQNRSEAFVKLVIFPITGIGTLLAGANVKSIWQQIPKIHGEILKIFPKWTVNSIFILLGIVLITVFVLLLKYVFTRDYTQKDNLLRQKKETWVRHVEAIGNYQKEMLGYIWEMNEYAGKTDDEKDTLLVNQIMKAWMKDNQKFISNMSAKK